MKTILSVLAVLVAPSVLLAQGFHKSNRKDLPAAAILAICADADKIQNYDCPNDFRQNGIAYSMDANDDGTKEFLIHLGFGDSGTGGDGYTLLQQFSGGWREIGGPWQLYHELRLRVLETKRGGYHDLRIGRSLCVKWDGKKYVRYEDDDFRKLSAALFDATDPQDAELLWLIRHVGQREAIVEPQWVRISQDLTRRFAEVADPASGLQWVSSYKGDIWGVKNSQAFLVLPRSSYLGATELRVEGAWIVAYGDSYLCSSSDVELARYNPATYQLVVGKCTEIPFEVIYN